MSLDQGQLDTVGKQQLLTRPFVYHKTNLFAASHAAIAAVYPNLASVLDGEWNTQPGTNVEQLNVRSLLGRHRCLQRLRMLGCLPAQRSLGGLAALPLALLQCGGVLAF